MQQEIIKLQVIFLKEGETAVVYSPALDLSGYGHSLEDAQKDFHNAVTIFLDECKNNGTLDDAFTALGWKHIDSQWQPQIEVLSGSSVEEFSVPA